MVGGAFIPNALSSQQHLPRGTLVPSSAETVPALQGAAGSTEGTQQVSRLQHLCSGAEGPEPHGKTKVRLTRRGIQKLTTAGNSNREARSGEAKRWLLGTREGRSAPTQHPGRASPLATVSTVSTHNLPRGSAGPHLTDRQRGAGGGEMPAGGPGTKCRAGV